MFRLTAALLLIFLIQATASARDCAKTFDTVLTRHLAAIDNRDLESYMSTIAPRDEQLMILPDGSRWESIADIRAGHESWFEDMTWRFDRSLLRKDVRSAWGLVVYQASVNRPDKPGAPFILSMLFAPESDGCWYLQHDQNTLAAKIVRK